VFYALRKLKAIVTGDIGCYTLGFMPPLSAMDTCICMGASIGNAAGISKVLAEEEQRKVVAVIGDSTFLHTGINGLMNMVYNQSAATVIILDNRITAMTGRQENPTSGYMLNGQKTYHVDIGQLCKAVGVKHIKMIDPYDLALTRKTIREEMARSELSVIKALSKAAVKQDTTHRIILMVEMGDLREGIMPLDLEDVVRDVIELLDFCVLNMFELFHLC